MDHRDEGGSVFKEEAEQAHFFSVQALLDIAERFNHDHVKYLVVGGLAVVAHGYTRLTADVDIVVDFGEGNERRAIEALKSLGYKPRIPEPIESFAIAANRDIWARDKDMLVFTVVNGASELDMFLKLPFDFDAAYAVAMWKTADEDGKISLPFVDFNNLIAMKQTAARPKDLNDIENLLAIQAVRERNQP